MPPRRIAVCLEVTPEQAVAAALDWPGWCRAGRDEGAALAALAGYARRYARASSCVWASAGRWPRYTLAEIYADRIDWHQVARLARRGCPPGLALRIAS
jgi:hypothetical protein